MQADGERFCEVSITLTNAGSKNVGRRLNFLKLRITGPRPDLQLDHLDISQLCRLSWPYPRTKSNASLYEIVTVSNVELALHMLFERHRPTSLCIPYLKLALSIGPRVQMFAVVSL